MLNVNVPPSVPKQRLHGFGITCALSSMGDPLSAAATFSATSRTCDKVSRYAEEDPGCNTTTKRRQRAHTQQEQKLRVCEWASKCLPEAIPVLLLDECLGY